MLLLWKQTDLTHEGLNNQVQRMAALNTGLKKKVEEL